MVDQAMIDVVARESAGSAPTLEVDAVTSLEAIEPVWRALEARAAFTPYQRFDWIAAYLASGFEPGISPVFVTFRSGPEIIALLPLSIKRRFGLRIGQIVGMPISNGDSLVFDPRRSHLLTREALAAAFRMLAGKGVKLDLLSLHAMPATVMGHPNPLMAFKTAPGPDHYYFNTLTPGTKPYIEESLPHKRRTNIRRSMRRLEEGFGPLRLHRAASAEDVEIIQTEFIRQRGIRFRQMGVENIFANAAFTRFFRDLSVASLGDPRPAVSMHALYAGETILATSIGTYGPSHYSQYINSTTDGEAAKYTLMGVTMSFLVDEMRGAGVSTFDMGLGDFDYKTDWTNREVVYDCVIPVGPLGAIGAPALRGLRALKRTIKQTPLVWKMARKVLALKARLKRPASEAKGA